MRRSRAVWGDYDNDGDLDIFVTGMIPLNSITKAGTSRIYRADGGHFTIADSTQGVYGSPAAWEDYDNDGDLDVLLAGRVVNGSTITKIYRNNIGVSNKAPNSPTNLASVTSANAVIFSWDKSTDYQTAESQQRLQT